MSVRYLVSLRLVLLTVTVAMLFAGLVRSETADAYYTHTWSCFPQSAGVPCNDTSGQIYNDWWYVTNKSGGGYYYRCAKARGQGGTVKQGSSCGYSSGDYSSCLVSNTPSSQAYVYFDFMGGVASSTGFANTANLCA